MHDAGGTQCVWAVFEALIAIAGKGQCWQLSSCPTSDASRLKPQRPAGLAVPCKNHRCTMSLFMSPNKHRAGLRPRCQARSTSFCDPLLRSISSRAFLREVSCTKNYGKPAQNPAQVSTWPRSAGEHMQEAASARRQEARAAPANPQRYRTRLRNSSGEVANATPQKTT